MIPAELIHLLTALLRMRFYFHLYNGSTTLDQEGVELEDEPAALRHGQVEALAMAVDSVSKGFLDLRHFIEVADGEGNRLFRVTFGEVVEVEGNDFAIDV